MKKNKLTTAVVAGIAGVAGIASVSNAVYLNDKGVGEVLIYPYYTVNNNLNTLLSVVNTTANVKAVKVRFLEGDNSLEVLDFNVYMSPYDVWTAGVSAITSTLSGHAGEPSATIGTTDKSCTPGFPGSAEFRSVTIDGDVNANNRSMERATSGHFEVIDMGSIDRSSAAGAAIAASATHGTSGVPSCTALEAQWISGQWHGGTTGAYMANDFGGLFGGGIIINPAEGFAVSYEAIALQDFWSANPANPHTAPGDLGPTLGSGGQANSTVFLDGKALNSLWLSSATAVSAVFMKDRLYNEYYAEASLDGSTEWVVSFPTKRFHVQSIPVVPPFSNVWNGVASCEIYDLTIWDREEQAPTSGIPISPTVNNQSAFCQEVNVLEFLSPGSTAGDTSAILGETNLTHIGPVYDTGWGRVGFNQPSQAMPGIAATDVGYNGLPVVGFAVIKARSSAVANYGVLFDHRSRVTSI